MSVRVRVGVSVRVRELCEGEGGCVSVMGFDRVRARITRDTRAP